MLTPTPHHAGLAAILLAGAVGFSHLATSATAQGAGTVTIDFLATSADGRPVTDLTADQVSVKINGRDRAIKGLKVVQAGDTTAKPGGVAALPLPFASNAGGSTGRTILIAFDEETIRPGVERPVRDALDQFMATLTPADRVGLVTTPRGQIRVDPTTSHDQVREGVAKLLGRMPASVTASDRGCRTRDALQALRGLLSASGGGPMTLIVFSSMMIGPNRGAGSTESGACELTTQDMQNVTAAAAVARAQVYVVQPDTAANTNIDGLENLAGDTGGQILRLTTGTNPIGRIGTETSAYYLASFTPEGNDQNGQVHRLEVKVNRPGVNVRARHHVSLPKAATGAATPRDMVRTSQAYTDLPLRATAFTIRGKGDQNVTTMVIETTDATAKLNAATVALVGGSAIASQSSADEKQLAISPLMMSVVGPPGAYRLRAAATDATGRSGAVDLPVDATLAPAGPMKLSGLILGSTASGSFRPVLEFKSEATIIAYMEMYGTMAPGSKVAARIEIAQSETGPALQSVVPGGRGTNEPDKFQLTAELPIGALAPGDYLVRAFLKVDDQPEGKVVRTLRKLP